MMSRAQCVMGLERGRPVELSSSAPWACSFRCMDLSLLLHKRGRWPYPESPACLKGGWEDWMVIDGLLE